MNIYLGRNSGVFFLFGKGKVNLVNSFCEVTNCCMIEYLAQKSAHHIIEITRLFSSRISSS